MTAAPIRFKLTPRQEVNLTRALSCGVGFREFGGVSVTAKVQRRVRRPGSVTSEKVIFCLLVLCYLVPLWSFRYIPTQDGPSHLANAEILKKYHDAGAERVRAYFVLNLKPIPNLLYHLLLAGLLYVFKPLIAEKVLLSAYVVLFAYGLRALGKAAGGRAGPAAFLVFPVIYSFAFQMGFFGFMFSLAVATLGVAYYWRRRGDVTARLFVVLNLLGVVIFFFHLLGWVIFMGGIVLLAWADAAREFLIARRSGGWRAAQRKRLIGRLAAPLYLAPAGALGLFYCLSQGAGGFFYRTPVRMLRYLYQLEVLRVFDSWQKWPAAALGVTFGGAVVVALAVAVYRSLKGESRSAEGGRGAAWIWGIAVVAAFALYFFAPDVAISGGYISDRLALLPLIAASAWLAAISGNFLRRSLFFIAPAVALAYVATVCLEYHKANADLKEFNTGRCCLTGDATILPVIYLSAPHSGCKVNYMEHAGSYYTLGNYNVDLLNFEAECYYFPINWRCGPPAIGLEDVCSGTPVYVLDGVYDQIDFLVCWRVNPFLSGMQKIFARYALVHSTPHMMILRRQDLGA